jgi:hypothetical protein
MSHPHRALEKRQRGAALLITTLVLTLVSVIAFTAIRHAEQESTSGARSRSTTRAVHAADAGVELALVRLMESPPNLNAFDVDLSEGANLQSRTRTQGTPQDLGQVGIGEPQEGYAINVGAGVAYVNRVFQVNVTAQSGRSTAELEAKLGRMSADSTGY